jgi:hypothetical protein
MKSPAPSRRAALAKQCEDATEWMECVGWLPREYECELHGIVEQAFKAGECYARKKAGRSR